ncbi:hypothetical protein V2J09_006447 [Rumex salicifolius]
MEENTEPLFEKEEINESGQITRKKNDLVYQRRKRKGKGRAKEDQPVIFDQQGLSGNQAEPEESQASMPGVSSFDPSVENHLRAMDKISVLCGEDGGPVEEAEMKRLSEMVTFLSEWKHFNYKPRTIRFASETGISQGKHKHVLGEISLSQYSSAAVPMVEGLSDEPNLTPCRNDFVFYAGGSVWALDWCPMPDTKPNTVVNNEFIAVSSHPPGSAYHKLGAPLSGRGMVQIWCLLNDAVKEDDLSCELKTCTKSQKRDAKKEEGTQSIRPRGRPRKHPVGTMPANLDTDNPVELLTLEYPEVSSNNASVAKENDTQLKRPRGRPRKNLIGTTPANIVREQPVELLAIEYLESTSNIASVAKESDAQPKRLRGQHGNQVAETGSSEMHCESQPGEVLAIEYPGCSSNNCHMDETLVNNSSNKAECSNFAQKRKRKVKANSLNHNEYPSSPSGKSKEGGSSRIPKDILPPRVVLCLGHNGKVAWDVKWRPYSTFYSECKHRLGYLAVLLGDGSLEVWEVPSPKMMKAIYLSRKQDSIDPRFVKLKPVFRCSKLRCGDRQSIPLTLEWSTSLPHDLILAGCHDGMVALWKFSACSSSKDVRPILCFSADTLPIRTLAWAPSEGDPFRPLWDISAQRFIYSLDWLPDPRCILTSYDDGTLRILSLAKAAYDTPVTGKPFAGTPQQGLHTYSCSPFSIWNIQVSRHTGMVAYCGSNGTALYFQLTSKAVDKDPHRNRTPHFLCGSMTDEDGILVVNTPLLNAPYPMKRSINEWGNTPRSLRGFIYDSNRVRRAKEQNLHNQPLALSYGEEVVDGDLDQPMSMLKNVKTKTSKGKKAKEEEASSSKHQESSVLNHENGNEIQTEALPSKMVAIHRVRWNANKGSWRWLSYGGAAGIVRCKEIVPLEYGRKGFK